MVEKNHGLHLQSISIHLHGQLLAQLDTHIAPGQSLTVMGPSGSGKSTLLAVIIGTAAPIFEVSGRILVKGRDVTHLPTEMRRVGILFQDDLLFPHLSVGSNLAFGLKRTLRGKAQRQARIEAALDEIGLPSFAERDPATLSGGQKARISLMRMLLSEPEVLLLDEPFSRLDAARRDDIRKLVFNRARTLGLPVLLVTHDAADAEAAGGAVIEIDKLGFAASSSAAKNRS